MDINTRTRENEGVGKDMTAYPSRGVFQSLRQAVEILVGGIQLLMLGSVPDWKKKKVDEVLKTYRREGRWMM